MSVVAALFFFVFRVCVCFVGNGLSFVAGYLTVCTYVYVYRTSVTDVI